MMINKIVVIYFVIVSIEFFVIILIRPTLVYNSTNYAILAVMLKKLLRECD